MYVIGKTKKVKANFTKKQKKHLSEFFEQIKFNIYSNSANGFSFRSSRKTECTRHVLSSSLGRQSNKKINKKPSAGFLTKRRIPCLVKLLKKALRPRYEKKHTSYVTYECH